MSRQKLGAGDLLIAGGVVFLTGLGPAGESHPAAVLQSWPGHLRRADCRVTGGVQPEPRPGGPWPAPPPGHEDLLRIARAAKTLAARLGLETGAEGRSENLHALGVLRLGEGKPAEAVAVLEALLLEAPPRAEALSDLSAAYLMRSRAGRPFDLVLALVSADRALALDRGRVEALFNRAEALTRLHLVHAAEAAWRAYLAADRAPGWAASTHRRRQELHALTLGQLWVRELPRLQAALASRERPTIEAVARRLPDRVRLFAEERLAEWAESDGEAGEAALAAARALGAALAATRGDWMIADTVAAIDGAAAGDAARLAALRRGHAAYGRGYPASRRLAYDQARPLFAEAQARLAAGGSPFAAWPELSLGVFDLYVAPDSAGRALRDLRRRLPRRRYPALAGRIDWTLGILEGIANRPEEALDFYRSAAASLDRGSGLDGTANLHVLIASAYANLGQPGLSWQARLAAFAGTQETGDSRYRHAALHDAAEDLLEQGQPAAALAFADEELANARAWGTTTGLAEAHLQRGRALARLGRVTAAAREFREGRVQAEAVEAAEIRRRHASSFDVAEGAMLAERSPAEAIPFLERALDSRRSDGYLYRVASLLRTRARAYWRLGDLARAEADYTLAIAEHEAAREVVRTQELRVSAFEQAQGAFEEMVRLQVDHHGDAQAALGFAERARSRLLLDLVGAGSGADQGRSTVGLPRALPPAAILARMPPEVVLIEYLALPDRLLAWIVRRGSLRLVEVATNEAELARSARALQAAIRRRAAEPEFRRHAARLYELLVRPAAADLAGGAELVVVPDRTMAQIPFAALFDSRRREHLIDRHSVTVAPSATLHLAALARSASLEEWPPRDVLAVGDPAFDVQLHPRLGRLDVAAEEAAQVAALYPGSELLRGEQATRPAFLVSAPGHQVVHFAGHSQLHPTAPQLSGLLFARQESDSGTLHARDLAGLRLERTALVVLSSCRTLETAVGSRESLVGLAAAFLASGPPAVVASLWKVDDDDATRELMVAFHRALRQGRDPASALRAAQRQLLADPTGRFRAPAHWAPFAVFGGAPARKK